MGIDEGMRATTKLSIALVALAGLCVTAIGAIHQNEAGATTAIRVQQTNPTITITPQPASPPYTYNPAQLNAKVGQPITVTNNDPNGVHSVTAKDRSFSVDVPPKSSVTLTVQKAGSFPYHCTYHADEHNPASINVS
jgi:plastocyanin